MPAQGYRPMSAAAPIVTGG